MTRDASQNQQTPRHPVRQPPISDATAGHPSSESQDPEAVVPTPTLVPDAQNHAGPDPYGQTTHAEGQGQGQNQTAPFGGIGIACDICFGFLDDCPRCTMNTPYNPVVGDDEDLYSA